MRLCDRCTVSDCRLDYLCDACYRARATECPEVQPTNAKAMACMSAEELANFLSDLIGLAQGDSGQSVKEWLSVPYCN